MTTNTLPGKQTETLISDRPIRKSFFSIFLRWEWLLVALIILVIFVNTRLSPFFLNAVNLSRTSSDFMEIGLMMLPMVIDHHHWKHRSLRGIQHGDERFIYGAVT
jgi:hypothetical protein